MSKRVDQNDRLNDRKIKIFNIQSITIIKLRVIKKGQSYTYIFLILIPYKITTNQTKTFYMYLSYHLIFLFISILCVLGVCFC